MFWRNQVVLRLAPQLLIFCEVDIWVFRYNCTNSLRSRKIIYFIGLRELIWILLYFVIYINLLSLSRSTTHNGCKNHQYYHGNLTFFEYNYHFDKTYPFTHLLYIMLYWIEYWVCWAEYVECKSLCYNNTPISLNIFVILRKFISEYYIKANWIYSNNIQKEFISFSNNN